MSGVVTAELRPVFLGVLGLLVVASVVSRVLRVRSSGTANATLRNMEARIGAWWVIFGLVGGSMLAGRVAVIVLFGLVSFMAMREFVTLAQTREADHRALLVSFFAIVPLQYALVADRWYGLYVILVPVYAFALIPTLVVLAGKTEGFLGRVSSIQWSLMVCVYSLSYLPAIMDLELHGFADRGVQLLVYLILVTQLSDVAQYTWGKLLGRRAIAPSVSPNKTWEGFLGGVGSTTLLGVALTPITPFSLWQSALMALIAGLAGFCGGLVMSAIKRDRGVKDFGALIPGHGGVLDRVDSLVFAAPLFFHLTRYYFGV